MRSRVDEIVLFVQSVDSDDRECMADNSPEERLRGIPSPTLLITYSSSKESFSSTPLTITGSNRLIAGSLLPSNTLPTFFFFSLQAVKKRMQALEMVVVYDSPIVCVVKRSVGKESLFESFNKFV